uniref:Uncharacterized protein n=1 Tax=Anguilla anguilla TaxID=7936 RepID=A0A0E9TMD9_ANGAN
MCIQSLNRIVGNMNKASFSEFYQHEFPWFTQSLLGQINKKVCVKAITYPHCTSLKKIKQRVLLCLICSSMILITEVH